MANTPMRPLGTRQPVAEDTWIHFCIALLVACRLLGSTAATASVTLEGFVPGVGTARDVVIDATTNLAYVASKEFGLAIVDVSNPSHPVAIGGATPPFYGSSVALSGSLAVVGSSTLGMTVVDVSLPAAPKAVGFLNGVINGVARAGQFAYVLKTESGNPAHTDLVVLNLSTPATPAIVGRVTLAGGAGIKVAGGLAYVATGGAGLQIVDVSTPTAPAIVSTVSTPGSAKGVAVANGYAYVADSTSVKIVDVHSPLVPFIVGSVPMSSATAVAVVSTRLSVLDGGLLKIVDVTLPISPTVLGSIDAVSSQTLDALGSTVFLASPAVDPAANKGGLYLVDVSSPANPRILTNVYGGFASIGVAVSGSVAVASGGSIGMRVVDISIPSAPRISATLSNNIGGVALVGQYAYGLLNVTGNPAHTDLQVIDLRNPAAPVILGQLTLAGGSGITVSGGFAYVTCGSAGMQIIDITTPAQPRIVKTLDTPGAAKGVVVAAGYAYVADNTSVQVVDVHTPATAFIGGSFPTTAASAVAVAGNQLYVIDGLQLKILDVSSPTSPALWSTSDAYAAQALDASGSLIFLARPAILHSDPGGVYVVDASNPAQPQLMTRLVVPGLTRAVAATASFVYASDDAATIDIGRITLPAATPTPTSTPIPPSTPTSTRSATPLSTSTPIAPTAPPPSTPTRTPPPASTPTRTFTSMPTTTPTRTFTPTATTTSMPTATFSQTAAAELASAHDAVVLPMKPVNITVPAGKAIAKKLRVKVRNADAAGAMSTPIMLAASSNCPAGVDVGTPDFIPSTPLVADDTISLAAGHTATAVVTVTVHPMDFANKNHKAPSRCTVTFTAHTQVPGNGDPTLANNSMTVELNVIDKNVGEVSTSHESLIGSLAPITVNISKSRAAGAKSVKPKVTNADVIPAPESTADAIQVTVDLSECPGITADMLDMDGRTPGTQDTVMVTGGKVAAGSLHLSVDAGSITTASKQSPARCTAVVSAAISGNLEPDDTNNTTLLVIDVVDKNDF